MVTVRRTTEADTAAVLRAACTRVGLDPRGAAPIRIAENALYRLPGGTVVRIARSGQLRSARQEVNVARWLASSGVPAVHVLPDIDQPVDVDGRAVTFWRELPPHHHGTPEQVAGALRRLHDLDPPTTFELTPTAPFVRLADRIDNAATLGPSDRGWMREHLADLTRRYAELPAGLPHCVVHGDAWVGNVVATNGDAVVLLDLERCSIGPPEWDLVHTAIKRTSFSWITAGDYAVFCRTYGHDVTTWAGFALLRDIREFRMACMAAQLAAENPDIHDQAAHRLACLRSRRGSRPWGGWHPVP
jgi:aminoglycoside phosphotransferase (APT) family kinase protein